jgi:hypothetical protein
VAKTRDEMMAVVMLEKADLQLRHWFGRFNRGFETTVTQQDIADLADFVALRDELRQECSGQSIPELPERVSAEVEDDPDRVIPRAFVGMGM